MAARRARDRVVDRGIVRVVRERKRRAVRRELVEELVGEREAVRVDLADLEILGACDEVGQKRAQQRIAAGELNATKTELRRIVDDRFARLAIERALDGRAGLCVAVETLLVADADDLDEQRVKAIESQRI